MKLIPLTRGLSAMVDDEDYDYLNKFKWHAVKSRYTFYAVTNNFDKSISSKKSLCMHRMIIDVLEKPVLVDHADRDGLNNQKYNLRECSHSSNCANRKSRVNSTSNYIGVSWCKKAKKWKPQIMKDGKRTYLGAFKDEKYAALVYNEAAKRIHGEFANLNKI